MGYGCDEPTMPCRAAPHSMNPTQPNPSQLRNNKPSFCQNKTKSSGSLVLQVVATTIATTATARKDLDLVFLSLVVRNVVESDAVLEETKSEETDTNHGRSHITGLLQPCRVVLSLLHSTGLLEHLAVHDLYIGYTQTQRETEMCSSVRTASEYVEPSSIGGRKTNHTDTDKPTDGIKTKQNGVAFAMRRLAVAAFCRRRRRRRQRSSRWLSLSLSLSLSLCFTTAPSHYSPSPLVGIGIHNTRTLSGYLVRKPATPRRCPLFRTTTATARLAATWETSIVRVVGCVCMCVCASVEPKACCFSR